MRTIRNSTSRIGRYLGLLLALCLTLAPTSIEAGGIGEAEVRAAVETWVRYVTADARPDAVVERMEPYQVDGETVAYIAHLKGGGFCLCGANDLVLPVYFYSPQGTYDPQNPNHQYILWEIGTRLKSLQRGLEEGDPKLQLYQQALSERATFWQELIAGRAPTRTQGPEVTRAEPISMTLDLTSHWDQDSPYNDQCPELTPLADEHTLIGCNATATAQIMYYWKWPNTGVGNDWVTYSYRWRSGWDSQPLDTDPGIPSNYGGRLRYDSVSDMLEMNGYWDNSIYESAQGITDTMTYTLALAALWSRMTPATKTPSADFGATTYDWSIIQDDHTDPPDAGDAEVAKLNAHVAIAVSTTFGLHGSQTNFGNAVAGLEDHFRYDPDALWTNPAHEADIDSLIEEIQWLRPAGLGGSKPPEVGGGHAWVVSAYNKGTDPWELWMNMGWEGRQDGWYSWDTMPFSHTNDMMTLVAPLDVVKFVGADNRGDGSPDDPYEDIEEAIANAPDGATLIFKAGSDNTFSAATLIINRPFTLKGKEVTVHEE